MLRRSAGERSPRGLRTEVSSSRCGVSHSAANLHPPASAEVSVMWGRCDVLKRSVCCLGRSTPNPVSFHVSPWHQFCAYFIMNNDNASSKHHQVGQVLRQEHHVKIRVALVGGQNHLGGFMGCSVRMRAGGSKAGNGFSQSQSPRSTTEIRTHSPMGPQSSRHFPATLMGL